MRSNPRGKQGIRGRLALITVGTLAGLVLAEGMLAFFLPPPIVWRYPQERYENHPTRLFDLRPNQKAFTHDKPVKINALGLRGGEVAIPKAETTYRVVVLGDSVTFGNGVRDDETYSAQLARIFHDSGFPDVEVVNAGIPAYNTWQEALLLKEVVLSLEPDLVILGFYENDIIRRPGEIRPIIDEEGEPPRSGLAASMGDVWIARLKRSRVLLLAWEAYQRARARWWPSPAAAGRTALVRGDRHPALEAGWTEVEKSLRQMGALLKQVGVPFRIVIFPMPEQVWNRDANSSAYQDRLRKITKNIEIPTLDLLPAFRKAAADGQVLYIFWDWHPNVDGHRVAARTIASFVQSMVNNWMVKNTISDSSESTQTITDHPNLPTLRALPASVREAIKRDEKERCLCCKE